MLFLHAMLKFDMLLWSEKNQLQELLTKSNIISLDLFTVHHFAPNDKDLLIYFLAYLMTIFVESIS